VLREGETSVPAGLRAALDRSNRRQDIVLAELRPGRTGNEILRDARARMRVEGIDGTVYSHPIGLHGHGERQRPALILALGGTAQLIRIMRANLLDELRKPYVVTARAKGISESRALLKYPVRAALNPFASSSAYLFPYLVSGSIVVSLVLGLPTVGPLLLQALVAQDMFLAGTIVLLLGVLTVIGTLISDLLLMWIEPRIRLQGRA